jgi:S-DNA-T family DNA segregation ATPase FtsK/SpoIIIE
MKMASSGRQTSSSNRSTKGSTKRNSGTRTSRSSSRTAARQIDEEQQARDRELYHEIGLIGLFIAAVILFFCNFGIIGPVGNAISGFLFGIFGFSAYIAPVLLFLAVSFWLANSGNPTAVRKLAAGAVLFIMFGIVCELVSGAAPSLDKYDMKAIYEACSQGKKGGGILAGSFAYLLYHYLETIGTILVVILCSAVSIILLTEKSLIAGMKDGGSRLRERTAEENDRYREAAEERRRKQDEQRTRREEERARREKERKLRAEEKENEQILRMEKKVSGVTLDTALKKNDEQHRSDDIHEIKYNDTDYTGDDTQDILSDSAADDGAQKLDFEKIQIRSSHQVMAQENDEDEDTFEVQEFTHTDKDSLKPKDHGNGMESLLGTYDADLISGTNLTAALPKAEEITIHREEITPAEAFEAEENEVKKSVPEHKKPADISEPAVDIVKKTPEKPYRFPPIDLLNKGKKVSGDSTNELRETAMRLQQTLNNFGVKVTITDISQGPSVTRYELQPEQGVKVSKIVSLTDDIKLNLAATDIRIEAPIPGKAAIGIEVPNKENMMVALRDLLESKEYNDFNSNLAFAVGKDIAGKVVVADIAKMPHMLIAGSTGSGKSVCINTLIMSIIYKAHPDDVKLIMIDPKVVELSVYNGIPHLLLDVVTDPKKASAALHWGVTEMEDRYRKLADFNVRDIKEYNKKVEAMKASGDVNAPAKMPQIVIIVDELADLMMVAPGEVEESICRLAQLARAAGIHLVIATQRPSVDVITGLIKANMPSRVAFAVSSGVDSRTILDMNGAEKLLGKGDMLFYPQGYSKPARIQGAFVSDSEVSDVVDFLKNQRLGNNYAQDIEEKLSSIGSSIGGSGGGDSANSRDEYFEQAGRFIIDKDKASIGMLQRVLKIGFNRAARIMDQLCDYGVVGEEEGTKPRKVLMSIEQFEQLLEEI